uniref:RNA-dependent RNA polymerase, eukaryotic-type n=1 Tax=Tanacetum cinerariifolium TaxID=118510 RepID=A0A6L2NTS7_TANCI|nr:RNA-dependent RNA polymerase, eukaryotic-type [Tanacetum cinerariifolium]
MNVVDRSIRIDESRLCLHVHERRKLEDVESVQDSIDIKSMKTTSMFTFKAKIWAKCGRSNCKPSDRAMVHDLDSDMLFDQQSYIADRQTISNRISIGEWRRDVPFVIMISDDKLALTTSLNRVAGKVSASKENHVNSLAVPRKAKEANRGITNLTHIDVIFSRLNPGKKLVIGYLKAAVVADAHRKAKCLLLTVLLLELLVGMEPVGGNA